MSKKNTSADIILTDHEIHYLIKALGLEEIAGFGPAVDVSEVPVSFVENVLTSRGVLIPGDADKLRVDDLISLLLNTAASSAYMLQIHCRKPDDEVVNHWMHFGAQISVHHSAVAPNIHRLRTLTDAEDLVTALIITLDMLETGNEQQSAAKSLEIDKELYQEAFRTFQEEGDDVPTELLQAASVPDEVIAALLKPEQQCVLSFIDTIGDPSATGMMVMKSSGLLWCVTSLEKTMRIEQADSTTIIRYILAMLEPVLEERPH